MVIPLALLGLLLLWAIIDSTEGASAATLWNHRWRAEDGQTLGGYLITPPDARRLVDATRVRPDATAPPRRDGRYPAVLLIHEWWGLNPQHVRVAEILSAHGYVVLAPDALRGRLSVTVPGALFQMATIPSERIDSDLDTALDELISLEVVDPGRIAVAGFCFGGTQAMRIGTRRAEPEAIAIFYGGGPITDAADLGLLGQEHAVLGIWGADDRTIPTGEVEAFENALRQVGGRPQFTVFDGVGHAFVNPRSIVSDPTAREAWGLFLLFLRGSLSS